MKFCSKLTFFKFHSTSYTRFTLISIHSTQHEVQDKAKDSNVTLLYSIVETRTRHTFIYRWQLH